MDVYGPCVLALVASVFCMVQNKQRNKLILVCPFFPFIFQDEDVNTVETQPVDDADEKARQV